MAKIDPEVLRKAYLAFRREHGTEAVLKVLADFGADSLDDLAEKDEAALLEKLAVETDDATLSNPRKKTPADTSPDSNVVDFLDATRIYGRWNNPPPRSSGG